MIGELISIAIGVVILLSALGYRLGPKSGKIMKVIGGVFFTLLFITCLAATIGLVYVGTKAHWSSDGPGMLLVMIGIGVFGAGTLTSGAFCLVAWGSKPRDAVASVSYANTEPYSPFGLADRIPGMEVISGWRPFVVAVILIGGPLLSLAQKMPTIIADAQKTPAPAEKRPVVDFSQVANSPAQSVAKGPRWVIKIGEQLAVLRLGQFSPEWIVPTQVFLSHHSVPTFQNRFIIVGSSPVEVWDLSLKKKIYSAPYSFDALEAGLLGDRAEFIATVVGSSKKPLEFKVENIETHEVRFRFDLRGYEVGRIAFDPAGRFAAITLSRHTVALFDVKNNSITYVQPETEKLGSLTGLVFSSDGLKLAVGTGRAVAVYTFPSAGQGAVDLESLNKNTLHLEYPRGSRGGLSPIQFSTDSSQLIVTDNGMSFARFDLLRSFPPEILRYSKDRNSNSSSESAARLYTVSPKGDQLVARYDGSEQLLKWDVLEQGQRTGPDELCPGGCQLNRRPNGNLTLQNLEYSPDGWWIMIHNDDKIQFWNGIKSKIVDFDFKMPAPLAAEPLSAPQDCPANAAACVKKAEIAQTNNDIPNAIESLAVACELGHVRACAQAATAAESAHRVDVAIKNIDLGYLQSGGSQDFIELYKTVEASVESASTETNPLPVSPPNSGPKVGDLAEAGQCSPVGDFTAVPYYLHGKCEGLRVHSSLGNGWLNLKPGDIIREKLVADKQGFCSLEGFTRKLTELCAKISSEGEVQSAFEIESASDGHKTLFNFSKSN